ncbi:MAG: family 16 glycosylhydrolase [Hyphomonadaceae bacterium]
MRADAAEGMGASVGRDERDQRGGGAKRNRKLAARSGSVAIVAAVGAAIVAAGASFTNSTESLARRTADAEVLKNDTSLAAATPDGRVRTKGPREPGDAFIFRNWARLSQESYYLSQNVNPWSGTGAGFRRDHVERRKDRLILHLTSQADRGKDFSGAEFQVKGFYGYGRYEIVMRPPGGSGAYSAFFTHTDDFFKDPHDEIDIEFLGRNTRQMHINHFTDNHSHGSYYAKLPFDFTDGFHLYAFEWSPDAIRWYADDQFLYEVRAPEARIPDHAGRVITNIMTGSDAAVDWMGKRDFGGSAQAEILCMSHVPLGVTAPECSDDRDLRRILRNGGDAPPAD